MSGDLLSAITGSNQTINPRNIVFIEFSPYRKGKGGVSNGTFLDPWGGPYQVALATSTNNIVTAGTNHIELRKRIAVWTDPGQSAPASWWQPWSTVNPARRYVTSWE